MDFFMTAVAGRADIDSVLRKVSGRWTGST